MDGPTAFPDLDEVLSELLAGMRDALGDDLCGLYLVGSFAVGDADEHSDVDFIAVTEHEVTPDRLARLQALHAAPLRPAQLRGRSISRARTCRGRGCGGEGSVGAVLVPRQRLDRARPRHALQHRASCAGCCASTAVTLDGPDPSTLRRAGHRRAAARRGTRHGRRVRRLGAPAGPTSRWKQPYLVTTFCRILHTLETGRLVSKQAALEWARGELPNEWRDLVQRALDDRPDPWRRVHEPADEAIVAETLAFADWVVVERV